MMDRYAVMGNPVAHSKSPQIHRMFAQQTGQTLTYEALLVPVERFAERAREFVAAGGKGFNVTLPFKGEACRLVDRASDEARRAGAVNTVIVNADGSLAGHNTDGPGLVTDLERNLGWVLAGARVLLLGAGGAAAGVLPALLAARPAALVVANRTPGRAEALVRAWPAQGVLAAAAPAALATSFDLVVNATSASLYDQVPELNPIAIGAETRCYDLFYAGDSTPFNRWAAARGAAATADGLGMLVEQAALAFELWRGVRPDSAPVIASLRHALSA